MEEEKIKLEPWQLAVRSYLDKRSLEDELFAQSYAKEKKSIEECCRYILQEARKKGNNVCMKDEEVFGLAVHYYDEDDIVVEKNVAKYSASTFAPKIAREETVKDNVKSNKPKHIEPTLFDFCE